MIDNAVTWFGITIENALSERVKVKMGNEVEYRPKYTLARLLHPDFKLPKPPEEKVSEENPLKAFMGWLRKPGGLVKRFMYKPPEDKQVSDG